MLQRITAFGRLKLIQLLHELLHVCWRRRQVGVAFGHIRNRDCRVTLCWRSFLSLGQKVGLFYCVSLSFSFGGGSVRLQVLGTLRIGREDACKIHGGGEYNFVSLNWKNSFSTIFNRVRGACQRSRLLRCLWKPISERACNFLCRL